MPDLSRRSVLRGLGVSLSLPFLEAATPSCAAGAGAATAGAKRLVSIGNPFGFLPHGFFPKTTGRDYQAPFLLEPLKRHRAEYTVFSNLDHGVSGGHVGCHSFLTSMRDVEAAHWADRNVSIDQRAAERLGSQSRFPSMVLSAGKAAHGEQELRLSWTRNGVNVPPIQSTRDLFNALFLSEEKGSLKERAAVLDRQGSILDTVRDHARSLHRDLGAPDRAKLDEYLTSVREVERKIQSSEQWLDRPKPKPGIDPPSDTAFTETLPAFFDLIVLALQTDSTRVATLGIPSSMKTGDLGLTGSYHGFSHHGKSPKIQEGLAVIEKFQMEQFARFLDKLKEAKGPGPDGKALLEDTMVLFGSGLGNGSSHSNKNLPILLAGAGLSSHGEHRAYPKEANRKVPLSNLYTAMLQNLGVEIDKFGKASGAMTEVL